MTPRERRKALEPIFAAKKWAQFGQRHDSTTANGSEACTHTVLQALIYLWTGNDVTFDDISAVAGYTTADVGMNSGHVDRVISHYSLPYEASFRMPSLPTVKDLVETVREKGPILMAVPYGFYPLDAGLTASGPNGTAYQGGRNDLGFSGNHAVCLFGARWRPRRKQYRLRGMDPDHGSPLRPEIPPFDIYTQQQLAEMWNRNLVGKTYGKFAYLATESWEGVPGV